MPISSKVSQDIQFLNDLDPGKFSISLQNNELAIVGKRSAIRNFFSWVIYLITFTLLPRNRELDQITRKILNSMQADIGNATADEKELADKAVRNLQAVIRNNGGSESNAVDQMLQTIAKIQVLPAVQKLSGIPENQEDDPILDEQALVEEEPQRSPENGEKKGVQEDAPLDPEKLISQETPKQESSKMDKPKNSDSVLDPIVDDTKLQRALQDLMQRKATAYQSSETLAKLLPELNGSVTLSHDELAVLGTGLERVDRTFLSKHLSSGLLTCIVKNSLLNANFVCLIGIIKAQAQEPFNKEQITAFVNGFKPCNDPRQPRTKLKDIDSKQLQNFLWEFIFHPAIILSLKTLLTVDEIKCFVKNLFDLVADQTTDDSQAKAKTFSVALMLTDKFGSEYVQTILKALCGVKPVRLLAEILFYTEAKDNAIELILTSHPPEKDASTDTFFQQFIDHLKKEEYFKIADYIFNKESLQRKQILASKLSPKLIAKYIDHIPTQQLADLDDLTLQTVVEKVADNHLQASNDQKLKALAQALTGARLYTLIEQGKYRITEDFFAALLPLCAFDAQVGFVSKVLNTRSFTQNGCLEKAALQLTVWEEASKQNPLTDCNLYHYEDYSPEALAGIVNGQAHNHEFLSKFFRTFFEQKDIADRQKACVAKLKPEVFEFSEPEKIRHQVWYQFFKILRDLPDQELAQQLLVRSTVNLFNSPGFSFVHKEDLYALKRTQLELLPIAQYIKPEIRLLLACLTNRLNDQLIDTANSLYDQQGGNFINFFEGAYIRHGSATDAQLEELYCFAFNKDIHYLKYFLTWLLDRPSIMPLLHTWTWINEYYSTEVLLRGDIQDDPVIQGHVKRLLLKVNKPRGW